MMQLWEFAARRRPIDRAVALLCCAQPERSKAELVALPIGQRDAQLLALREQLMGPTMNCYAECPRCSARLQVAATKADLRGAVASSEVAAPDPAALLPGQRLHELQEGDYFLRFRLPDSADVAEAARCGQPQVALALLLQRCVVQARCGDAAVAVASLPAQLVDALAAAMARLDPQSDLAIETRCPHCGNVWDLELDIASFFFAELADKVQRLAREVHLLAHEYGWRESDILAMTAERRQLYLGIVGE
jgi:hypothetical protein